jgi:dienelactone hydrolase
VLARVKIEPFLFNVLPSPASDRVASSIAWHGPSHGLSVLIGPFDGSRSEPIFSFDKLLSVPMSWSFDGRFFACAQYDTCGIWEGGRVTTCKLPAPVRELAWDTEGTLWGLSRDLLWRASPRSGFKPGLIMSNVMAMSVAADIVAVRRNQRLLEIVFAAKPECPTIPWPLSVQTRPAIARSADGCGLFVFAQERSGPSRLRTEIAYVNVLTGDTHSLFAGDMATGLGGPIAGWSPWTGRSALLVGEIDEYARVFRVDGDDKEPLPLSPPGLEVSGFAASVATGRVAIIGTPSSEDPCSLENWLFVHDETLAKGTQNSLVSRGVNSQPSWDAGGRRLFYIHAIDGFRSQMRYYEPQRGAAHTPTDEPKSGFGGGRPEPFSILELRRPATTKAALIHLQGPHRRFLNGPQPTFFHHALLSLLEEFADSGVLVQCPNSVGALGKGRDYREGFGSWLTETVNNLAGMTADLKKAGFERIGIIAGSLGALPAIHFLTSHHLAAAAFVSPVYHPHIPALKDWQHLFGDTANLPGPEQLAATIRTPLLILHGLRDEMSAAEQSSRFVSRISADVPCDYLTFPDEEHIFRRPDTWETGLSAAIDFLRLHLNLDREATEESTSDPQLGSKLVPLV